MYADDKINETMQAGKYPVVASTMNSSPTSTVTNGTVTNPGNAYDKSFTSYATFSFGYTQPNATYYDVYGFNTSIATPYQVTGIDVKIKYSVSFSPSASAQYRIAAQVGSKETQMQSWSSTARTASNRTIANVREPNDGVWNWTDISNLRIHFEGRNMTATGTGTLNNYETSISLPNSRVVIGVHGENLFDLFSFQFRINFTTALLDVGVSGLTARVTEGSAFRDSCIAQGGQTFFTVKFNNTAGTLYVSDTMQDPAYRGIDGNATLIWIEFLIQDYGYSDLIMYDTGMADSFANPTVHTTTNGWFDNRITGDSDGSGIVTIADMGEVSDRWTSPPGVKPYERFVDWDNNGVISISDMGIVSDNWGRFVP
jgi:hypothetical protein